MLEGHAETLHRREPLQGGVEIQRPPSIRRRRGGLRRLLQRGETHPRLDSPKVPTRGDPPHPGDEGAVAPVVAYPFEGGDQGVLGKIIREVRRSAQPAEKPPKRRKTSSDKDRKRAPISSRSAAGEKPVRHLFQVGG